MSKISDLTPDKQNANKGTPRGLKMLDDSLRENGAGRSILIDKHGVIVAGNKTVERAADIGIEDVIVVETDGTQLVAVKRTDLDLETDPGARRLAYADNRVGQVDLDFDADVILADLEAGVDLDGLFTDIELEGFGWEPDKAEDPGADMDKADELQEKWGVKRGDLFVIPSLSVEGKSHRILCGDSTDAEDVANLMGGERADAVVADPPYGVGVDYESFDDTQMNTKALVDKVMPFMLDAPCAVLTPGIPMMWHYPAPTWLMAWVHPAATGSCPWGLAGLNPILAYGDDPYLKAGMGRRHDNLVLAADREGAEGHPVQKPLPVWAWLVERVTPKRGQVVADPFLGSGTTCVAAENLGRVCFGSEICEKYVSVSLERLQDLGLAPELVTDK